jgi:hypothetical protein
VIDLEDLYFEWLLTCLDPDGVSEGVAYVGDLLHNCTFERRVGLDINRAKDGANLRKDFLDQFSDADFDAHVTNDLLMLECSWFEMLVALSQRIDYLYDGGVEGRFIELVTNLGLEDLLSFHPHRAEEMGEEDQHEVDIATANVDNNQFDRDGHGGIFPLNKATHPDQREVEIWDQQAAYFTERLEGVLWTSTS